MKFNILNITDLPNGGATIDIEITQELRNLVKNYYNRKRCTNKLLSTFVNEGITNYLKNNEI